MLSQTASHYGDRQMIVSLELTEPQNRIEDTKNVQAILGIGSCFSCFLKDEHSLLNFFMSAGEFLTREETENKRKNEPQFHTYSNEHNPKCYMCKHRHQQSNQ